MNSIGKIGLDDKGMRTGTGSGKMRLTRLVEPSGGGTIVIARSKRFRSAYERRSNSKRVSMLLVCAAAIIIVSAVAVAALGSEKSAKVPGRVSAPFPLVVYGNTLNSTFDPIPNCTVTITLVRTGANVVVMSDGTGLYSYDIKNWTPQLNDVVSVTATCTTALDGTRTGTNTGIVTGTVILVGELQIDVVLTVPIPEFTGIVIPLAGMISIFAVARVASNKRKEE